MDDAYRDFVAAHVRELESVLQKAETGDFSVTLPEAPARDEFSPLYAHINRLIGQMNHRIAETEARSREFNDLKSAMLNVLEDLDEEKAKLQEAKALDDAILASIGEGLMFADARGRVIFINKAAEKMLQYKNEEIKGKIWPDIVETVDDKNNPVPPEEQPWYKALTFRKTFSTSYFQTHTYRRRDGSRFVHISTASPVLVGDTAIGVISVFRDITHEKEIDRAKNDFISLASHQLRTPLTSIRWVVERFLKREPGLSPEGREYLQDIHMAAMRLGHLVDGLLNVSRIEKGDMGVAPEEMDVVQFVRDYMEESKPLAAARKLNLSFSAHPASFHAKTDPHAFRNIIQSLISNALEYTLPSGSISVSLEKRDPVFLFTVSDTGVGIPKDDHEKIFQKFSRGSNANVMKTEGTGLGLYMTKEAVGLLGGRIWFESEENNGTKFFVELPLESKARGGEKMFA